MSLRKDFQSMLKAYQNGIRIPYVAMKVAREQGFSYGALCAVLEIESSGGYNIFGHDPTIYVGAGHVTKKKYLAYKKERDKNLSRRQMQGVGPMQLTWWSLQDEADSLGGCWVPYNNVTVGTKLLKSYYEIAGGDWVKVGKSYNGAQSYGELLAQRVKKWESLVGE